MNKKFLSMISMFLGISLSCITNLITGDNRIVTWFENNKLLVIVIGLLLTIFSLIVSYISESESKSEKNLKFNKLRTTTKMILNSITLLVTGLVLISLIYFLIDYFSINMMYNYIPIIIVGAIIGTEFKYVGGNEFQGIIAGAFLSLAFSYYFPEDINLNFLPKWLNEKSILSIGVFGGILGLYTGIYKDDILAKEKESIKRENKTRKVLKKEKEIKYANDTKQFFRLKNHFKKQNYELFTSSDWDDMKRNQLRIMGANEETIQMYKELQIKEDNEEKSSLSFLKNIFFSLFEKEDGPFFKLKSPFYLYDNNFQLVGKFQEILELIEFVQKDKNEKKW